MSEWHRINPVKFNRPRQEKIHGTSVEVFASPYEVPIAVRGGVNLQSGNFVVEFKYIGGEEPLFVVTPTNELQLELGRNSKRIFRLELASKAAGIKPTIQDVVLALDRAIADLSNKENYDLAKLVVKERADKLKAAAAAGFEK